MHAVNFKFVVGTPRHIVVINNLGTLVHSTRYRELCNKHVPTQTLIRLCVPTYLPTNFMFRES